MARTVSTTLNVLKAGLVMLVSGFATSGCSDLEVVTRGRYVEIATDRDDPLCAGTISEIDDYVEAVASLLGARLPDERFLRIEWRDGVETGEALTRDHKIRDDVIVTNDPYNQHELAHGVHLKVWPRSHRALEEGLATMLGSRGWQEAAPWPEGKSLDSVLEWNGDYAGALFIVSQIVNDDGFEGLRALWDRLAIDSGATEFRTAFAEAFGRSADTLIEPVDIGGIPHTRFACFYEVCTAEVERPSADETWRAQGPTACEGDDRAIGSRRREGELAAWTHQVVELGPEARTVTTQGGVGAIVRRCGLGCNTVPHNAWVPPDRTSAFAYDRGEYLVEIGHSIAGLPAAPPSTLTLAPPP